MYFILHLFLVAYANVSDPDVCQAIRQRSAAECMSDSCSGLLTTGTGTNDRVRDPESCRSICTELSVKFSANEVACAVPMPLAKPDQLKEKSAGQAAAQKNAAAKAEESEKQALGKQKSFNEAGEYGKSLQKEKIGTSEELLRRWDNELNSGKSRSFPADRAKWKNDKNLVEEAKRAREKNEFFPSEKANRAVLPAIRGELNQFSRARRLESESTKSLGAIALTLSELAKIKKAGEANAQSLNQNSAKAVFLSAATSRENKRPPGQVSSKLNEGEKAQSDLGLEKVNGDSAEATAPASAGATTGGPASPPDSLKARLRELLRKKMAAQGLGEMPEEFLGELGLSSESPGGGASADRAADLATEGEEIFRLAGAETDAAIRRLRAELQEELARSEGVLAAETLSLFDRVKAAHRACVARQCVLLGQQLAGKF